MLIQVLGSVHFLLLAPHNSLQVLVSSQNYKHVNILVSCRMEMRILDLLGLFNVQKEFASRVQEFSQYIVSFVGFVRICFFPHIEEIF